MEAESKQMDGSWANEVQTKKKQGEDVRWAILGKVIEEGPGR